MEAAEFRTKWTHPNTDVWQLSESMQSIKLPEDNSEDMKSVLFSLMEEVKSLSERLKAVEEHISEQRELEEERESTTPEDPLTMLPP